MKQMKIYVKHIVLALLMAAILIGLGAYLIDGIVDMELRKSTYTRTQFDFHIAAPDRAQVESLASHEAVACVFPYFAFTNAFSKNDDVLLLVSDDIQNYHASLLTTGTQIEGKFDPDGVMLDQIAAAALGVGVGDKLSFQLLGKSYSKVVSAIYLPSSLPIMENGIALVAFSEDMAESGTHAAYGGAFLVARDHAAVSALLSNYVGEGNVALSYEQYVALYCGTILPNQTEEEYNTACQAKYQAYRADVLAAAKKDGGQVVNKQDAYSLLKEKVLTTESKLANLELLTTIAAFAVFSLVSILFIVTNGGNDRIRRDAGLRANKILLNYLLTALISAAAVAAIAAIVLSRVASGTYFASDCTHVVIALSLPVLVALIPVSIAAFIYVRLLYRNSATEE